MIGASKILTVSYGTFSCTLEGFDDPFNTMRAIAEYFRDLAAEDRYFGAEPPTPDAAMLHKIAEREVQRRVEAKIQDNGVILRTGDAMQAPAPVPMAQVQPTVAPTRAPVAEPFQPGPMPDGVAAKLMRIRAAVANAERAEAAPVAASPAPAAAVILADYSEDQHAEDLAPAATFAPEVMLDDAVLADPVLPDAVLADVVDADAWDQAESAEATPSAADADYAPTEYTSAEYIAADFTSTDFTSTDFTPTEYTPTEKLAAEMLADDPSFDYTDFAFETTPDVAPEVAPASVPEDDAATADTVDADNSLLASLNGYAGAPSPLDSTDLDLAADIAEAEADSTSAEDLADLRALDGDAADPVATDAEPAAEMPEEATADADAVTAEAAPATIVDETDIADTALDDDDLSAADFGLARDLDYDEDYDDFAADDLAATFDAETTPDTDADTNEAQRTDPSAAPSLTAMFDDDAGIDAVTHHTDTAEETLELTPDPVDPMIEEIDNAYGPDTAPATGPSEKVLRARARVIKVRREDTIGATDAAQSDAVVDADQPSDTTARLAAEAEADLRRELRALQGHTEKPTDAPDDDATETGPEDDARQRLDPAGEAAVSRLMDQTNEVMAVPENRRRLSAIAHLKAAVAATVADRFSKGGSAPKEAETKRLDPYREDLARVVRPLTPTHAEDATPTPRPAPLVLVSAQRIDRPRPAPGDVPPNLSAVPNLPAAPNLPVRPRRVTSAALAVDTPVEPDDDEDDIETAALFTDARGFAEFSERLGANSLAEILEAAAAYSVCIEGRPYFSRPQLMSQIGALSADSEFTREDGLRTFGALLREGRIQKIKRGQFVLTENSRYLAEARNLSA